MSDIFLIFPWISGIFIPRQAGQWREILALATAMGGRGITPHSMTCNAVLKAERRTIFGKFTRFLGDFYELRVVKNYFK